VAATEFDPIALEHFELHPEPVPAEVLGGQEVGMEVWALRLAGGPVRDVLTSDPTNVGTREYVFALPIDVVRNLALALTQVCEREGRAL